jgi:hypothetical protein
LTKKSAVPDERVRKLIDAFAAELLALNEGRAIPTPWRDYLRAALKPKSNGRGRKLADRTDIVRDVVRHLEVLKPDGDFAPERSAKTAELKRRIAKEHGVSVDTVERVLGEIPVYVDAADQWEALEEKKRAQVVDGYGKAIAESLNEDLLAERVRRYGFVLTRSTDGFDVHRAAKASRSRRAGERVLTAANLAEVKVWLEGLERR